MCASKKGETRKSVQLFSIPHFGSAKLRNNHFVSFFPFHNFSSKCFRPACRGDKHDLIRDESCEIYNAKVGGASSPQKPKEVSPTKKLFPSSQFPLSFFTGSTQVAILHFHLCE